MAVPLPDHVRVAVIGSGFSGIGAGHRLKEAGIDDFVILERGPDVGGTWRDNTYPGAACDVPSNLYSFSFAPNPDWSRSFSAQPEIQAYLRRCAEQFGLRSHLRFGHEVTGLHWEDDRSRWRVTTSQGEFTAHTVLAGGGPLADPALPDIKGLDRFQGKLFHSSRWDHDYDLTDRQVAVIGTGASAIQFVPQIQPHVARLDVYQRTAPWILPRTDRALTAAERTLYRNVPLAQKAVRTSIFWAREAFLLAFTGGHTALSRRVEAVARRHLNHAIADPALRARLTPDFTIGCKRILLSNDYYPALTQPNCDLVTDGIAEIREHSVVTRDGTERATDAIILGTGFMATDLPLAHRIHGRGGRLLADAWRGGMSAHQASTVAGFPNLFFLVGPNSGLGHSSMTCIIEAQIRYAVDALTQMERRGIAEVEVLQSTQDAYNERLQQRLADTVWANGGCASWYLDPRNGRNTTLWPGHLWQFQWMNRRFDPRGHRARTWEQVGTDA